jgi:hypothetical protein
VQAGFWEGIRSGLSPREAAAGAWHARLLLNPITSSPGENPPVPAPASSMTSGNPGGRETCAGQVNPLSF